MAFRVKEALWLATETERVKHILLVPRYWRVRWTQRKLREMLADIGMGYSAADIDQLNTALHAAGVVEDVEGD